MKYGESVWKLVVDFLTNLLLFHGFLQSGEQLLKRVCKPLKTLWFWS